MQITKKIRESQHINMVDVCMSAVGYYSSAEKQWRAFNLQTKKVGRELLHKILFLISIFFQTIFFRKTNIFKIPGFIIHSPNWWQTSWHAELRRVVDRSSKFFSIFEISADSRPLTRIPLPSNMGEKEKKRIAVIGDSFVDIVCAGMTEMPTWDGDTLCESIK